MAVSRAPVMAVRYIRLFCCWQRAEAQLAYELQEAKEKQKIRNEEISIDIIERKKQIQVS